MEQPDVAVVSGPRQQTEHHGVEDGDFASPLDVLKVAVETDDDGEPEAGFGNTLNHVGRFRGIGGDPLVGDVFGKAAELDDGELGSRFAFEGTNAAAELGDGHGIASDGE